jgi:S1-C subfamily serine protease
MSVEDLSRAFSSAVKAAGASVLRVEGRRRRPPSSGVAVAEDLIVTAHHCVDEDDEVEVGLPAGEAAKAEVVGRDPSTDLALLRLPKAGLSPVSFEKDAALEVGTIVLSVFRPGKSVRAALGIVSAAGESWRTPAGGQVDRYVQSDIAPQPGFSGSLLVDGSGKALGINTAGLLRGAAIALPGTTALRVVQTLRTHGHMRRGYLGIGSYPVPLPAELRKEISQKSGLLVVSVEPGSPASRAGLFLGDTLLSADGKPVAHAQDLLPLLEEERIGTRVEVGILRAGERKQLEIEVGERGVAAS